MHIPCCVWLPCLFARHTPLFFSLRDLYHLIYPLLCPPQLRLRVLGLTYRAGQLVPGVRVRWVAVPPHHGAVPHVPAAHGGGSM